MTLRSLGCWPHVGDGGVYPDTLQAVGEKWLRVQVWHEEIF